MLLSIVWLILALNAALAAGTLDWSAEGYTTGSFNQTYNNLGTPGVNVNIAITGSVNDLNDAGFTTPQINNGELLFFPDFEDRNETVTIALTFSQPVSDLSFTIRDIDQGGWQDRVTVNGTGPSGAVTSTITPDTTPPTTYTVAGNVITGAAAAGFADATPITFNGAVTQITLLYGNGPGALANPSAQLIWLSDLSWENEADLLITKDDSNTIYAPGQTSTYTLTVTNNGPGPVLAASILDNLTSGITLTAPWSCSATGGSSCSAATGGVIGGSTVSLNADIAVGGVITVTVPVQFSANMGDY